MVAWLFTFCLEVISLWCHHVWESVGKIGRIFCPLIPDLAVLDCWAGAETWQFIQSQCPNCIKKGVCSKSGVETGKWYVLSTMQKGHAAHKITVSWWSSRQHFVYLLYFTHAHFKWDCNILSFFFLSKTHYYHNLSHNKIKYSLMFFMSE